MKTGALMNRGASWVSQLMWVLGTTVNPWSIARVASRNRVSQMLMGFIL